MMLKGPCTSPPCALSQISGWRDHCLYPLARGCRAPRRIMPEPWTGRLPISVWRIRLAAAAELWGQRRRRRVGNTAVRVEAAFHLCATFPRAREGGPSASGVSIRRRRRAAMGTVRREPIETPLAEGSVAGVRSGISGDRALDPWACGRRTARGQQRETRRLLSNRPGPNFDAESNSKRTATRQQLDLQKLLCNQTVEL